MTDIGDKRRPGPARRIVGIVKKFARVLPEALQRFVADGCPQQAAAIAYRVLFSIAPLAIVLVSTFGLVLQNDSVRREVVNQVVDALPVSATGKQDVENAINDIATPASVAGFVSLIVFAWAATGMMTALRRGLELAMGVTEPRPMARGKLVDLLLIVGAAALVLVSVGFTLLGTLLQNASGSLGEDIGLGGGFLSSGLLRAATFALWILVVLLLYRFVPAHGLRFRDSLAGAILTAVLFTAISFASGWIDQRTTELSVIYGSLTSVLVFVYSVYLISCALLLGAEVAAAWARPQVAGGGEPLLVQLRRSLLGLVVKPKAAPGHEVVQPRRGDDSS